MRAGAIIRPSPLLPTDPSNVSGSARTPCVLARFLRQEGEFFFLCRLRLKDMDLDRFLDADRGSR